MFGLEFAIPILVVAAILGGILASNKNRFVMGWVVLCLLMPICVLLIIALKPLPQTDMLGQPKKDRPPSRVVAKVCPQCGERYQLFIKECAACKVPLVETDKPAGEAGMSKITPEVTACPFCKEDIRVGAIKCKHCGSMLEEPAANSGGVG